MREQPEGGRDAGGPSNGFVVSAAGDLDGDGLLVLVVRVPGEDHTTGHTDRGAVTGICGADSAARTSYATIGATGTDAKFGSAAVIDDFNHDGRDDVFVAGGGCGDVGVWSRRGSATGTAGGGQLQGRTGG